MGSDEIFAPYNALGDYQHGALYLPSDDQGGIQNRQLVTKFRLSFTCTNIPTPVFDTGMNHFIETCLKKGMAVFTMDLLGYGSRIEEGADYYNRYPDWSKMGKMVKDTALMLFRLWVNWHLWIPTTFTWPVMPWAETVALFTAALEDQVDGVAIASAFTPLRESGQRTGGDQGLFSPVWFWCPDGDYIKGRPLPEYRWISPEILAAIPAPAPDGGPALNKTGMQT